MDEFSYTNIFATKGIEYLIVIAYFILFVFFTRALDKSTKDDHKSAGGNGHAE